MGNFIAVRPHIYVSGAVILAANHNANETTLYVAHNGAFNDATGHGHTGSTGDGPKLTSAGLDLTANFTWTGTHTFSAALLKVKGAGAGIASLQYANSATSRTFTFPDPGASDTLVTLTATQTLTNKTLTAPTIASLANVPGVPPIGSIIPFYDFNAGLTFNATYWAYCNGQSIAVGSLGAQTLPDLSNRYLVGFGTEGGGDNGSAAWATAAVGNASHQVNLQHSHTVSSHTHDLANHTHDLANHTHAGPSHTHDSGTLQFAVMNFVSDGTSRSCDSYSGVSVASDDVKFYTQAGSQVTLFYINTASEGFGVDESVTRQTFYTASGAGNTGSSGTGNTGGPNTNTSGTPSSNTSSAATPGTDSQLSTTQSIQPRSVRVRYIMRIL